MGPLLVLLGLIIIFLAISIRYVPSSPPHIAVVTFLGQRLRSIKKEGYRFFPYPFYNAILIDMTKKNQDLPEQRVWTSDLAELEISVSLTWTPNPDYAIEYLDNGDKSGVEKILEDMVRQRLREWTSFTKCEDAIKAQDEATSMLVKTIVGLQSAEQSNEIVERISRGDGVPISHLGITLNRLNIGGIKLRGQLARAAQRLVIEQWEKAGEKVELSHVLDLIRQIKDQLPDISDEQAVELAQTERGKVTKKIEEMKINISPSTMKVIEEIITRFWNKKV